jgi:hypothetical protein
VRWALLSLALLLVLAGLLYRGGIAFVSTLSEATASLRADRPATVPSTTGQVEAPRWPARADQVGASGMSRPESSLAPQPAVPSNPEDVAPGANEQHIFRSRRALETINPRELVR